MVLGCLFPKTDFRDYKLRATANNFPDTFEITDMPKVKNQRSVGSCVAHASSTVLEYFNKQETGEFEKMSTDFIYGMQGVAFERRDRGMYLRDACRIVSKYGDPYEADLPGNTEQPKCTDRLRELLNEDIYKRAFNNRVESYAKCDNDDDIKYGLMTCGPLLCSIKWYKKYTIDNDNIIHQDKNSKYGGHALVIYGWNEKGWLIQNSWGDHWNGDGKFVYPFGEKFKEVWSFVDAKNDNVYKPKRNSFYDIIYKIGNMIANFFRSMWAK